MNKQDLINEIARIANLTKKQSEVALNATIEAITDAIAEGTKITLVGFGTWEVRTRAARKGINPRTKEEISIPATKVPVFKPGKALKDAVTGSSDEAKKSKK